MGYGVVSRSGPGHGLRPCHGWLRLGSKLRRRNSPAPEVHGIDSAVRLVSFNIRNGLAADGPFAWPLRRGALLKLLASLDAEVFCLQEVLDFQLDEIGSALADYQYVGVGRDDAKRAGEFVPIFYRGLELQSTGTMWLSETPYVPGSIAWGARLPRISTWARFADITIANLHLDHGSEFARTRGIELLLGQVQADIVCGDFNAEQSEACIQAMGGAGYSDVGQSEGCTFNNFLSGLEGAPRIDYVFVRPPITGSARVVREPMVSDHWPVIAELARG